MVNTTQNYGWCECFQEVHCQTSFDGSCLTLRGKTHLYVFDICVNIVRSLYKFFYIIFIEANLDKRWKWHRTWWTIKIKEKNKSTTTECHKKYQMFVARNQKLTIKPNLWISKIWNWVIVYIEWLLENYCFFIKF